MISKQYFEETFSLVTAQNLQSWANANLITASLGDYAMKVTWANNGAGTEMFAETELTGISIGESYTVKDTVSNISSNSFRIQISDVANDPASVVAEIGYGEGEREFTFIATATTMYLRVGDLAGSVNTTSTHDNVSVKDSSGTEYVTNGTFEGNNTTGWYGINANVTIEVYEYAVQPPEPSEPIPDDPTITGTAYYFAEDGDDNNDGLSASAPKKSLDEFVSVMNTLNSGDGVLFRMGDTFKWTGSLSGIVNRSGLIISRYWESGDEANTQLPIFTGEVYTDVLSPQWSEYQAGVWIANVNIPGNRALLDGTEIRNAGSSATLNEFLSNSYMDFKRDGGFIYLKSASNPGSVTFTSAGVSKVIEITNCDNFIINGIDCRWSTAYSWTNSRCHSFTIQKSNFAGYSYSGLRFYSYADGESYGHLLHHNPIDTLWRLDYSGNPESVSTGIGMNNSVQFNNWESDTTVQYNSFTDFAHVAVSFGTEEGGNSPVTCNNCKILHNTFSAPNSAYSRPWTWNSCNTNCEIAYNRHSNYTVAAHLTGIGIHVHHNIFENVTVGSRYGSSYNGGVSHAFDEYINAIREDMLVENNIFYNFETHAVKRIGDVMTLQNNIFLNCDYANGYANAVTHIPWGDGDANAIPYKSYNNLFFAPSGSDRIGIGNHNSGITSNINVTEYNAKAVWLSDSNLEDNPDFVDTTEFRIPSSSPANDTGLDPTATEDYDGTTIVAPYNIGIYNTEV